MAKVKKTAKPAKPAKPAESDEPVEQVDSVEYWDRLIQNLESRLDYAMKVRAIFSAPDFQDDLAAFLISRNGAPARRRWAVTAFTKIQAFLRERRNEWASMKEIGEGTGLKRDAIKMQLYRAHREAFEKREREGEQCREFRLNATRMKVATPTNQDGATNFDKMRAWFEANGNRWASSREVQVGAGISRSIFSNTVYKGRADAFEIQDDPENPRLKQFRLKK